MRIRTITATVLTAVTAVSLTACGTDTPTGHTTGTPKTTATKTTPASTPQAKRQDVKDQVFINVLRRENNPAEVSDTKAIQDARVLCSVLPEGSGLMFAVTVTRNADSLARYDAGRFTGAAIGSYCPEVITGGSN